MYKRLGELIKLRLRIAKEIQSFPYTKDNNEALYNSFKFLSKYIKTVDDIIKEHKNGFMGEGYYKDY